MILPIPTVLYPNEEFPSIESSGINPIKPRVRTFLQRNAEILQKWEAIKVADANWDAGRAED